MSRDTKNAMLGFVFALVAVAAISGTRRLGWWQDQLRTDVEANRKDAGKLEKRVHQLEAWHRLDRVQIDEVRQAVFGKRNDTAIIGKSHPPKK